MKVYLVSRFQYASADDKHGQCNILDIYANLQTANTAAKSEVQKLWINSAEPERTRTQTTEYPGEQYMAQVPPCLAPGRMRALVWVKEYTVRHEDNSPTGGLESNSELKRMSLQKLVWSVVQRVELDLVQMGLQGAVKFKEDYLRDLDPTPPAKLPIYLMS